MSALGPAIDWLTFMPTMAEAVEEVEQAAREALTDAKWRKWARDAAESDIVSQVKALGTGKSVLWVIWYVVFVCCLPIVPADQAVLFGWILAAITTAFCIAII